VNHVDNQTQRHALTRRLLGAGSKEALAELLAEMVLSGSLRRGENLACMIRHGAAAADRLARIEDGVSARRSRRNTKRSRAWRKADAAFIPGKEDGGRGVDAPRTAG